MKQREVMIDEIVEALRPSDNDVGGEDDDLATALHRALLVGSMLKPQKEGQEEGLLRDKE